ncbi:MAG: NRDE family protein, partial [Betaproteobacteria bacterium]|nr:NRDE family protein [Betaproteobacteria bacterium]
YRVLPGVPLLVAANRDEYYARPARQAAFWEDHPSVLAGRDLQAGGTWLGVSASGRFAAVTNFRGTPGAAPGGPSRGELVTAFLSGRRSARSFTQSLEKTGNRYAGFCMLASDGEALYFYSNQEHKAAVVAPGVHGLSNHLLDTPWPKVVKGRAGLQGLLAQPFSDADYLDLMDDTVPAAEKSLPESNLDPAWERSLSSLRIIAGSYGTRCSTVVRIDEGGLVDFAERTYRDDGDVAGEVRYRFTATRRPNLLTSHAARAPSRRAESPPRRTRHPAR